MSANPYGLFNAWKAPLSAYDADPCTPQEIIFYCASRFRAAAIAISQREPQPWFQPNLVAEVVRALP
jgi:hypothetical protein